MEELGPEPHELFESTEHYAHKAEHGSHDEGNIEECVHDQRIGEHNAQAEQLEEGGRTHQSEVNSTSEFKSKDKRAGAELKSKHFATKCAITASILAVFAAISSLLAGHYANEAVLKQTEASDKWAYYQAKSTKAHVYEGDLFVLQALNGTKDAKDKAQKDAIMESMNQIQDKMEQYQEEKDDIQRSAESLENSSHKDMSEHEDFALAVSCFQIGIVLASVSILIHGRKLYLGSVAAGLIGLVCL